MLETKLTFIWQNFMPKSIMSSDHTYGNQKLIWGLNSITEYFLYLCSVYNKKLLFYQSLSFIRVYPVKIY